MRGGHLEVREFGLVRETPGNIDVAWRSRFPQDTDCDVNNSLSDEVQFVAAEFDHFSETFLEKTSQFASNRRGM